MQGQASIRCELDLRNQGGTRLTSLKETDIFPLRDSLFEGVVVKIPYEYTKLLEEEYGSKALTVTKFEQ